MTHWMMKNGLSQKQGRPSAEGPCRWNLLESIFLLVLKEVIHGRESHSGNYWKISHRRDTLGSQPRGFWRKLHMEICFVFLTATCFRNLPRKTSEPEEKPLFPTVAAIDPYWQTLTLLDGKGETLSGPSCIRTGQVTENGPGGNKSVTDKTGFAKLFSRLY